METHWQKGWSNTDISAAKERRAKTSVRMAAHSEAEFSVGMPGLEDTEPGDHMLPFNLCKASTLHVIWLLIHLIVCKLHWSCLYYPEC